MIRPEELIDGMEVMAQFSRRDTEDGTAPDWTAPMRVRLYVSRREKAIRHHPAGELLVMTPQYGLGWAEYGPQDWSEEFDEWVVEEYRMKILSRLT